ncbi:hypothetical protein RB595_005447 [Gaeumannomyces hyphopodioides]
MAPQKPHAIVSVDFGTECTKVAMAFLDGATSSYDIRILPFEGNPPTDKLNNLTALAYRLHGRGDELYWGYAAHERKDDPDCEVFRHFKLKALQAPDSLFPPVTDPTDANAARPQLKKTGRELSHDVLKKLVTSVAKFYASKQHGYKLPAWDDARVEVVLSVPLAVGKNGGTVLVNMARLAGFQNAQQSHRVLEISLTEAEAAAVQILHEKGDLFKIGDHVLIADLGGGTSDMSMLVLTNKENSQVNTDFFEPVTCELLGGAYIDDALEENIAQALHQCQAQGSLDAGKTIAGLASKLSRHDDTRWAKHSLGKRVGNQASALVAYLPIKEHGCAPIHSPREHSGIRFQGDSMQLSRSAFTDLFDRQIHGDGGETRGIVGQIVNMRDDLYVKCASMSAAHTPRERDDGPSLRSVDRLDFVVFSGGMGASEYVRAEIESALRQEPHPALRFLNDTTRDMKYLVADQPQLCVCQGLVRTRIRELEGEKEGRFWIFKRPAFMRQK